MIIIPCNFCNVSGHREGNVCPALGIPHLPNRVVNMEYINETKMLIREACDESEGFLTHSEEELLNKWYYNDGNLLLACLEVIKRPEHNGKFADHIYERAIVLELRLLGYED